MLEYKKTHPWLRFELDLRPLGATTWMLLGEAQSKCEHLAGVPLRPDTADRLHRLYLARGVLATTAIEGNTLNQKEVEQILAGQLALPPSRKYLQQEIENVVEACNYVWQMAGKDGSASITVALLKKFNAKVLEKLAVENQVEAGEIRTYSVGVARYKAAPAKDCRYLLQRLSDWLASETFRAEPEHRIAIAVVQAVIAHLYLAWIHPFGDGNGRTARLVEFHILIHAGVPTPAAHLLSNHYNETRAEYYHQLDRASRSGGGVLPFLEYAVKGFVEQLRAQIVEVRDQQLDVTWRNYVYASFGETTSGSQVRQRQLVLELGRTWPASRSAAEIPDLSPRLARDYATRTPKTLARDLNAVVERKLVTREGGKYKAAKDLVVAWLPSGRSRAEQVREIVNLPFSDRTRTGRRRERSALRCRGASD